MFNLTTEINPGAFAGPLSSLLVIKKMTLLPYVLQMLRRGHVILLRLAGLISSLPLNISFLSFVIPYFSVRENHYPFHLRVGMLSRYYQNSSGLEDNKALRIGETVTYIEEHFLQPITLQSMADMAYMSTCQFLRVFTRNYQTTPMDYVIRKRLDYSCTLLRSPDLSIPQVAMDSGFHDQNYYSRQFRNIFNCTPSAYREKMLHS
ncbi:helix-turn-helix domain-containing protein [Paenibacillus sp. S150]|uniref:helix-turn-helix domain-containing protein n=1 Tax=Paenibacillus sp. S150 TaxID=2749826 RepID=UPI001C577BAC|nr:AraC family transcriptional regulator [Paenibacillus sp. S150]MBW4080253.1 helix-turn-helix transcriptional regulator [Paenibacillus sp. S150]